MCEKRSTILLSIFVLKSILLQNDAVYVITKWIYFQMIKVFNISQLYFQLATTDRYKLTYIEFIMGLHNVEEKLNGL